jgi:serine protease Do
VLARVVNMRGVDLHRFDFDYDLTWMSFFMNDQERIYGRYGGRDAGPADRYLTLKSLKHAMRSALAAYRRDPRAPASPLAAAADPSVAGFRSVEQFPAAQRLREGACIHCHQVYEFQRQALQAADRWSKERIWVYPLPKNVGLDLDPDEQDRIQAVAPGSPADRCGLLAEDRLRAVSGTAIASLGDLQYALHSAPAVGQVPIAWQRGGRTMRGRLDLAPGWRETDISWRGSMWGLSPSPGVYGTDLTAAEKQTLGLSSSHLAFRQGRPVTANARAAGIQADDIIVGLEDRTLEMSMLQFNAYIRLHYQPGDRVVFDVFRDGQRLKLPMLLRERDSF